MVGFGVNGTGWTASISAGGSLELRWRDIAKGAWYGFRTGGNMVANSAVAVLGLDANGKYVRVDDPTMRYLHFGVRTNDDHFWVGAIDLGNWGAGLGWHDMTLVGNSGNWGTEKPHEVVKLPDEMPTGAKK